VEAKRAETIGNEVQASEAEGLEGREDGRCPQPNVRGHGKLQRAKANHTTQAREAGGAGDEGHPIARVLDARCLSPRTTPNCRFRKWPAAKFTRSVELYIVPPKDEHTNNYQE
jgi:hypothetical protein